MKYIVMETHPAYAVVLSDDGRFLKAANLRYEVGQTVTEIIEVNAAQPAPEKKAKIFRFSSFAAIAACLVMVAVWTFFGHIAHASVYMTINPEVRIDIDRHDRAVGLEGVNADGVQLIEGYDYHRKHLDVVVDELADRAIEMGFLHNGDTVSFTLDTEDQTWIDSHKGDLNLQLAEYLVDRMEVVIEVKIKGLDDLEEVIDELEPDLDDLIPGLDDDDDHDDFDDDDHDDFDDDDHDDFDDDDHDDFDDDDHDDFDDDDHDDFDDDDHDDFDDDDDEDDDDD